MATEKIEVPASLASEPAFVEFLKKVRLAEESGRYFGRLGVTTHWERGRIHTGTVLDESTHKR